MDWSNERYVRVYTRDTTTWKLMDWRGRAVLSLLIRKVDRAGVLDVGHDGVLGLAAVIEMPIDIVEAGIAQLTTSRGGDPTVVYTGTAYVLPNFMPAQEASSSDPHRKRESRARRRDLALAVARSAPITVPVAVVFEPGSGQDEPTCHETGQDRDGRSQVVTPCLAVPSRSNTDESGKPDSISESNSSRPQPRHRSKSTLSATPAELASVRVILDRLGKAAGVAYRGCDSHTALIVNQIRDGITEQELRAVVAYCANEWSGNPEMRRYLRPETLFGPRTISKYLDPARTKYARMINGTKPDADSRPQLVCLHGDVDGDEPPLGPALDIRPETA